MNDQTNTPNWFVRITVCIFCIFLTLMVIYNYFWMEPKGALNNGIIILLLLVLVLILSESFDNFSIAKLISITRVQNRMHAPCFVRLLYSFRNRIIFTKLYNFQLQSEGRMDRKTCMFLMVQIIFLVFIGSASAGSFWWSGYADWKDSTWSKVTISWNHNDMDEISKWKFCWKRKSNTSSGKNPCDYKTIIVYKPKAKIEVHWDTVFKFQVEGYNTKKGKWKTYSPTLVRPCFNARWSKSEVSTLCNP